MKQLLFKKPIGQCTHKLFYWVRPEFINGLSVMSGSVVPGEVSAKYPECIL
jgi:hypothetical protein